MHMHIFSQLLEKKIIKINNNYRFGQKKICAAADAKK
jgi:hypothetical protein